MPDVQQPAWRRTGLLDGPRLIALLVACGLVAACGGPAAPATAEPPSGSAAPARSPAQPTFAASSAPATPPSPGATADVDPASIQALAGLQAQLRSISSADPVTAQSLADGLWATLAEHQRLPLVLGNKVVFAHKGPAASVHWRGSFNGWSDPGLAGSRVGVTDLWIGLAELPEASRIEYTVVRDGTEILTDEANPATGYNGMVGTTSVLALPGFEVTDERERRAGARAGVLGEEHVLTSRHLGYPVAYRVYSPPGYDDLADLPVLYLLDGNDFADERMGAMPAILDNLVADGRIPPILAVFVDSREPGNPGRNRREDAFLGHPAEHASFIADELVPAVDAAYRTARTPEARTIAGVSYGGIAATYIAALRPDTFHRLAAFSPSLWVIDSPQYLSTPELQAGARSMAGTTQSLVECGTGSAPPCPPIRMFLSTGLPDWDVGDMTPLAGVLKGLGYAIEFREVREGHTWDQWRGLTDEMLVFLHGTGDGG